MPHNVSKGWDCRAWTYYDNGGTTTLGGENGLRAMFRDSEAWKAGDAGQQEAAEYLQRKGWYVLEMFRGLQDTEGAPAIEADEDAIVLPDLLVARKGRTAWVEVKAKAQATYTRKTGRHEHGFPERLFEDYHDIQETTGIPVIIMVGERRKSKVVMYNWLFAPLDKLNKVRRTYNGHKMNGEPMVFFPRTRFVLYKETRKLMR